MPARDYVKVVSRPQGMDLPQRLSSEGLQIFHRETEGWERDESDVASQAVVHLQPSIPREAHRTNTSFKSSEKIRAAHSDVFQVEFSTDGDLLVTKPYALLPPQLSNSMEGAHK